MKSFHGVIISGSAAFLLESTYSLTLQGRASVKKKKQQNNQKYRMMSVSKEPCNSFFSYGWE